MTIGIIELNDAGVRVGRIDQQNPDYTESPGVAIIRKTDLLLGHAAMGQARLHPVQTNSLFWHRLSAEPLALQNSQCRHHADLAYSHLLALHQSIPDSDQVIFPLPGSFTRQQMSLLLGIVGQCPFDAVGLVDSAVAASAAHARGHNLVHVDLQLHQCVFTQMQADGELRRTQVEVLPHCGLFTLRDRWAKAVADQFIDQSRFDPLHSASAEQSLYDQIPDWLQQLRHSGELCLEVSGKKINVSRDLFSSAVRAVYEQIIAKAEQLAQANSRILLGDRIAALPGLAEAFQQGRETVSLPPTAVFEGIRNNLEQVKTGSSKLAFVQSLPLSASDREQSKVTTSPPAEEKRPATATHLLIGDRAYPLGAGALYLDLDNGRVARDAAAINTQCSIRRQGNEVALVPHDGARVIVNAGSADEEQADDNCLLRRGDRLSTTGSAGPVTLIEVVEGNGT